MFLDGVRIPAGNRVGAENDGWRVAMVTFSFERGTAFVSELLGTMRLVADLAAVARQAGLWDDASDSARPRDRGRRARRPVGAHEAKRLTGVTARRHGVGGSVFKLAYHQTRERLGELALRVLGRAGLALDDPLDLSTVDHVEQRLYALSLSIAAGTTQIQRNIVGERLLGLPKER